MLNNFTEFWVNSLVIVNGIYWGYNWWIALTFCDSEFGTAWILLPVDCFHSPHLSRCSIVNFCFNTKKFLNILITPNASYTQVHFEQLKQYLVLTEILQYSMDICAHIYMYVELFGLSYYTTSAVSSKASYAWIACHPSFQRKHRAFQIFRIPKELPKILCSCHSKNSCIHRNCFKNNPSSEEGQGQN